MLADVFTVVFSEIGEKDARKRDALASLTAAAVDGGVVSHELLMQRLRFDVVLWSGAV